MMESKGPTLMGKLLSTVRFERQEARRKAVDELWKRNGLDNPTKREGYRMAETSTVARDGTEVTEYRLYKLLDRALVETKSTVKTNITYTNDPREGVPNDD